jgi:hypothetical protein
LATVACRRPVFDAALHTAVAAQPRVTHRATEVIGLRLRPRGHAAHVVGVELATGESMTADLVVNADYSRHYRFRDGEPMPPYSSLLGGPRGDLGYLAFATFLGDNRTFCVHIMVPPWDHGPALGSRLPRAA